MAFLPSKYYENVSIETLFKHFAIGIFPIFCLLFIIDLAFFNFFLTKMLRISDPINVCTINSSRVIIIWLVQFGIDFNLNMLIDVAGGLFITVGSLIYSAVIVLPMKKMEKSANEKMRQNSIFQSFKPDKPLYLFY